MKSKMLFAIVSVSLVVGAAGAYLALPQSPVNLSGLAEHQGPDPGASAAIIAKQENQDPSRLIMELAVHYLEHYGETISEPATQARLYNERRALLERYPSSGHELFEDAITTAFPELAGQILTLIANLTAITTGWIITSSGFRACRHWNEAPKSGNNEKPFLAPWPARSGPKNKMRWKSSLKPSSKNWPDWTNPANSS